ncbi:histone-lysine N-methyltransferase set-1-like [Archocentrus centrarchus]|uniref:histone-lysine N-methyltransferase set-1-like n=1 Tax=Archocentrus centrarchus TaxID=63155 RepID=UPI0011EA1A27|nr:histone-lysine N-methyltransferase set-1-like [Archocentrus centrarchus]
MKTSIRRRRVQPQHDAEYYIKLEIDKTGLTEQFINPCKGRGVIATQLFKQGDFILEYRGKLSKVDPYLQRDKFNDTVEVFLFDFKWKGTCWCIDASIEDKSLGRLVNDDHRRPNCKMKTVEVEGIPHLCLFALRDIEPGEEITYNYGKADWPWRKMDKSSTPEVSNQTGNDEHRHQDKSTPEVSNQTGNDEHCAQDKSSTPEVSNQTGNDEHRHQVSFICTSPSVCLRFKNTGHIPIQIRT